MSTIVFSLLGVILLSIFVIAGGWLSVSAFYQKPRSLSELLRGVLGIILAVVGLLGWFTGDDTTPISSFIDRLYYQVQTAELNNQCQELKIIYPVSGEFEAKKQSHISALTTFALMERHERNRHQLAVLKLQDSVQTLLATTKDP